METVLAAALLTGLVTYILYEVNEYARLRREMTAQAERARHRARFKRSPLDAVDDPREAGMVLLHLSVGRQPSPVQTGAMVWVARHLMAAPEPEALLARGRWLADQARDPYHTVDQLAGVLTVALDGRERRAFADALGEIARAEGVPDPGRATLVRRFEMALGGGAARVA